MTLTYYLVLAAILFTIGAVGVLVFKPGFSLGADLSDKGLKLTLIGAMMVTLATTLWSVYAVMVRLTMRGVDPRTAFATIALETTIGCGVIALIWGRPGDIVDVPFRVIVLVAVSGWICIALAHVFYYTAIQRIGVAVPTAVLQLTPFAVLTLSYFIYHERFTTGQLCSGVVVVFGAGMALWAQERVRSRAGPREDAASGDPEP